MIRDDHLTSLHSDGASSTLGNKLFRSLSSFCALEGSTFIRRERVTVRSSRELCWNRSQSEWLFTDLSRTLTPGLHSPSQKPPNAHSRPCNNIFLIFRPDPKDGPRRRAARAAILRTRILSASISHYLIRSFSISFCTRFRGL